MKRLKILILIFCVTVSVPLGYFIWQTYRGLEQEEAATLRFFANTLFDEIEQALETLVQREEARAIDEYNFFLSSSERYRDRTDKNRSPLSRLPAENYILGYLQNNPDGSLQTPLAQDGRSVDADSNRPGCGCTCPAPRGSRSGPSSRRRCTPCTAPRSHRTRAWPAASESASRARPGR